MPPQYAHNCLHTVYMCTLVFGLKSRHESNDIGEIHCCSPLRLTYIPEELFRTRDMLIENSQELNYESNENLNDEEDWEKTFTGAYTWKRCLHLQGACACKRFSVLGAFFEGSEEAP